MPFSVLGCINALIYGLNAQGIESCSSDIDLFIVANIEEETVAGALLTEESRIGPEVDYIVWSEKGLLEKLVQQVSLLRETSRTPVIMII